MMEKSGEECTYSGGSFPNEWKVVGLPKNGTPATFFAPDKRDIILGRVTNGIEGGDLLRTDDAPSASGSGFIALFFVSLRSTLLLPTATAEWSLMSL